jgi:pimeloyl-ACP methyl ester carboxylesterase
MAAALVQGALVGGGPRIGQLGDQLAQVLPRQAGEDRMGEGRTGPCWRRHPHMITRAACLTRTGRPRPRSPAAPRRRATRRHRPQRLLQPHAHPDGFQYERRSYWAVPDVYHVFSPLLFADRLDRPVLIVHGTDDPNPPTQPEQAVDLYRAIVATGGHAAWSSSPHEGHAFLFQESHQALVREHARWLRRCGGGGTRGTACRGIPSPPLR